MPCIEIAENDEISVFKDTADDTAILATIPRALSDRSNLDLSKFTDWTEGQKQMACCVTQINARNYFCIRNKRKSTSLPSIKQYNSISLLGVIIQSNCKFSLRVKAKLNEGVLNEA